MANKSFQDLLDVIQKVGSGTIRSSGKMSYQEIADAQACYRFYVDEHGFGYEFVPDNPVDQVALTVALEEARETSLSMTRYINKLTQLINNEQKA
jgi:hypothetical protein